MNYTYYGRSRDADLTPVKTVDHLMIEEYIIKIIDKNTGKLDDSLKEFMDEYKMEVKKIVSRVRTDLSNLEKEIASIKKSINDLKKSPLK